MGGPHPIVSIAPDSIRRNALRLLRPTQVGCLGGDDAGGCGGVAALGFVSLNPTYIVHWVGMSPGYSAAQSRNRRNA